MGKRGHVKFGYSALQNIDRSNSLFEKYYKSQLQLSDTEFSEFMSSLKTDLPVTFRITGFRQQSKELLTLLKDNFLDSFLKSKNDSTDSSAMDFSVKPLKWYPDDMAWQLNASRVDIRKSGALKTFQGFLVSETESGNISRQEAVSMLPPLLLNIKENHRVLDLCAAPGSKAAQLVELLHADAERRVSNDHLCTEPSGIVVANDFDRKRCYMLIHQVKRLQSPCVILTEEDASVYPRIFIDNPKNEDEVTQLLFDRILADVPCSGDGTMRKSPDIWKRWTPKIGRGHHDLQKRILRRGLELLRVPEPGSTDLPRLVYSTCSFNPVENEAVVASILAACKGAVRLVQPDMFSLPAEANADCSAFIARPGLRHWCVLIGKDNWVKSHDELPDRDKGSIQPSLFPPANSDELHLEHCRRILPHDQNTGGFFVAVMEKVSDLPWMGTKPKTAHKIQEQLASIATELPPATVFKESAKTVPANAGKYPKRAKIAREESSFVYFDPETDKDWPTIRDYYGISDKSNTEVTSLIDAKKTSLSMNSDQLLYRPCGEILKRRNIYYTNRLVKRVIQASLGRGLHIVSGGVKMFSICEDKQFTGYRLLHDGAYLSDAFLPRFVLPPYPPVVCLRRISLTFHERDDLLTLLREEMPLAEKLSETTHNQWLQLSVGPVLIEYDPSIRVDGQKEDRSKALPRCRLAFAGWRGLKSLRHYIDRHERVHVLRLCGLDCSVPMVMGKQGDQITPSEDASPHIFDSDSPEIPLIVESLL